VISSRTAGIDRCVALVSRPAIGLVPLSREGCFSFLNRRVAISGVALDGGCSPANCTAKVTLFYCDRQQD
jgi:hypothetical protein